MKSFKVLLVLCLLGAQTTCGGKVPVSEKHGESKPTPLVYTGNPPSDRTMPNDRTVNDDETMGEDDDKTGDEKMGADDDKTDDGTMDGDGDTTDADDETTDGGDATTDDDTTADDDATTDDDTTTDDEATTDDTKPAPVEVKYYTDEWLALFPESQLKNQPQWKLAEKQPEDGAYESRIYSKQWWASSFIPCEKQDVAASSRYMSLYFFFGGDNYQGHKYSLTYPILRTVDMRPVPTKAPVVKTTKKTLKKKPNPKNKKPKGKGKRRRKRKPKKPKVCPAKYTTYFYIPIPLKKHAAKTKDKTIKAAILPEKLYYVRGYASNYTAAYCKEQAYLLHLDLLEDNIWTHVDHYHCATYEAPAGTTEQKYEVWMETRLV